MSKLLKTARARNIPLLIVVLILLVLVFGRSEDFPEGQDNSEQAAIATEEPVVSEVVLTGKESSREKKDIRGDLVAPFVAVVDDELAVPPAEPEDTLIPLLANITAANITSVSAVVTWETGEDTTGKVYYSRVTPVNFEAAATIETTTPKRNHSFKISGLSKATKYYFVLKSVDAAGNVGTSIESSFKTLNE